MKSEFGSWRVERLHRAASFLLVPLAIFAPLLTGVEAEGSTTLRTLIVVFVLGIGTTVVALRVLFTGRIPMVVVMLWLLVSMYVVTYGISYAVNHGAGFDPRPFAQLILVAGWLSFLILAKWDRHLISAVCLLGVMLLTVNLTVWLANGMPGEFGGTAAHKNYLGTVCFVSLFFAFVAIEQRRAAGSSALSGIVLVPVAIVAIVASTSRGAQLSTVASFFTYLLWPFVARRRSVYVGSYILMLGMLAVGMWCYLLLESFDFFDVIQNAVRGVTGMSVYTGRQLIWPILLAYISKRPYFGYGPSAEESWFLAAQGLDEEWSAHNMYVASLLQVGVLGLVVFLLLFYWIWRRYYLVRNDPVVRLSAAFFVGICFHQMFEVSLTQNNLVEGMGLWAVIAVGLARTCGHSEARRRPFAEGKRLTGRPSRVPTSR